MQGKDLKLFQESLKSEVKAVKQDEDRHSKGRGKDSLRRSVEEKEIEVVEKVDNIKICFSLSLGQILNINLIF